jgi:hypothetical protein
VIPVPPMVLEEPGWQTWWPPLPSVLSSSVIDLAARRFKVTQDDLGEDE